MARTAEENRFLADLDEMEALLAEVRKGDRLEICKYYLDHKEQIKRIIEWIKKIPIIGKAGAVLDFLVMLADLACPVVPGK